jgi:hypothetical protein
MGQLESLREINIAESKIKERKKKNYTIVVHSDGKFNKA